MQPPGSLLDLQEWVKDNVGLLTVPEQEASLIDLSSQDIRTGQYSLQLNESTYATMQLLEGTMLLPINVEIDETPSPPPPKRIPSASMSTSTLDDLSQLEMGQPIDRRFPPTAKAGNKGTYPFAVPLAHQTHATCLFTKLPQRLLAFIHRHLMLRGVVVV
jgi:hypothetical protein